MRYIAFDFDGTIADSNFAICEAMERACIRNGAEYVGDKEFTKHIGQDLDIAIQKATSQILAPDQLEGVARSYRETFKYELVKPFIGIVEVLQECKANGDILGIATSRRTKSLETILKNNQLEEYFSTHICGDEVIKPKPSPEMLLSLSIKFGCKPQEMIVVGDTTWDCEMANAIGAYCVGVTWGSHSSDQLIDAGASRIVDSPEELQKYFASTVN